MCLALVLTIANRAPVFFSRKKALDFYQRMSTTGHCIAFSYRPLIEVSLCKIYHLPTQFYLLKVSPDLQKRALGFSFNPLLKTQIKSILSFLFHYIKCVFFSADFTFIDLFSNVSAILCYF